MDMESVNVYGDRIAMLLGDKSIGIVSSHLEFFSQGQVRGLSVNKYHTMLSLDHHAFWMH